MLYVNLRITFIFSSFTSARFTLPYIFYGDIWILKIYKAKLRSREIFIEAQRISQIFFLVCLVCR